MKDEARTATSTPRTRARKAGDKPAAAPRAARPRRGAATPSADVDAAVVTGTTALEATGTPVIPLRPPGAGEAGPATAGIEPEAGAGTPIIPLRRSVGGDVSSAPTPAVAGGEHVPSPPAGATPSAIAHDEAGSAPAGAGDAGDHAAGATLPVPAGHGRPDIPRATAGERAGDTQDGRTGGFKERALRSARIKFADDPIRSPLTAKQLDVLLDLLHEPGKDRTLISSTWTYLERGMSYAHASVTADKLRGTFGGDRRGAAA